MIIGERDTWLGYQGIAIGVFALIALAAIKPIEIGAAVAGTALLIALPAIGPSRVHSAEKVRALALVATAFLVLLGLASWRDGDQVATTAAVLVVPTLVLGALAWKGNVETRLARLGVTIVLVAMVMAIGMLWIGGDDQPAIDVLDLHRSAAEAVLAGENPYAEATAVNTSPLAGAGEQWVGYPYPPATLVAYGGSELIFGDSRWASVLAFAAALAVVVHAWVRRSRAAAGALIALALAAVAQPVLGHILSQGWTEPLALPLLAGAGLLWRRHPVASAVLLGLALGTKQYFIVALPLLALWDDDHRWQRLGIAGSVPLVAVLPAFALDPSAGWEALVGAHLDTPLRLDSIGLAGLGWDVPVLVLLGLGAGVAVWMAWRGGGASRFLLALAATLAIVFLLGSQSFLNYWFLVGMLAIVAAAADDLVLGDRNAAVDPIGVPESVAR